MVCERDPASPNDPAEGRIVARPRRRLADRRRDDPGRRRRGRDRGDDGARRRRVDSARPARAPDDGRRGGRARGCERPRRIAAHGLDPDQPRQRGGRRPHRRVRGQHRHVDPGRRTARCVLRRTRSRCRSQPAEGSAATRASRSRSGARTRSRCSAGCCVRRTRAVPFRLVSLNGGKSRNAIPRDAVAVCSVPRDQEGAFRAAVDVGDRVRARRLREDRSGRDRDGRERRTTLSTPGRRRRRPGCSTSSRSCRPVRSR